MKTKHYQSLCILFGLLVVCNTILNGCSPSPEKSIINIPENKVGLIGYGSLTSKEAIEETVGHEYRDSVYHIHLMGFKRAWNFAGDTNDPALPKELLAYQPFFVRDGDTIPIHKAVFLNIMPEASQSINGVLYFVTPQDLERIDAMELGYERIDVSNRLREYTIENGTVYAYKAKPEYILNSSNDSVTAIIDKAYVDLVFQAYARMGEDARKEFDASTKPFDSKLVAPILYLKRRDTL
ncbi:gamma-glutamylcyclotransferase family protein [Altibacter lentus]|uniref:gamma-glutamylcyclotransferase family protein n=1 Tax=Altibacter lentus TaxID=1223410 RepID=UPI00054EC554|nr:gamma-glutamylcyclotransferase family protein [Altibacter lentus]